MVFLSGNLSSPSIVNLPNVEGFPLIVIDKFLGRGLVVGGFDYVL